ncbi:MAG: phosphoribosylaminoimidazolesuccinocarboxamide synthase [Elusimicrobia bacterium RIFOXYD2_FULL_34_15]|nr:MAG: phosphoribosylaminoimidazolesuccinocarboxamide synthase [Elusimicrobia bacterium RIFOXYD2_FULL_34_15]
MTDISKVYSGKVRDVYAVGDDKLLIVATDRISCFDFILPTLVPDKGKILTKISVFWFNYLKDIVENHLISADINEIYKVIPRNIAEDLDGRSMLVKKGKRVDIEVIIRGYLSGSAWKEYQKSNSVCGIKLPKGLKESEKLPEIIFTPSTKAPDGEHDINITEQEASKIAGKDVIKIIKEKSVAIYKKASEYASTKGIIIADTKFEYGIVDGKVILIDEIFTPDSSRFWDKEKYAPGKSQENFDKQFVRDYLIAINWNKQPPVPELPKDIVEKTKARYLEVQRRLCE